MVLRVGVDIGGTFTDLVLLDERTGNYTILKLETTPEDPSVGFLEGLKRILVQTKSKTGDIGMVLHATTVATNAVLQLKGAKTALVTTKGFRDVLEIGRMRRPSLYDLFADKPIPLVPRNLRKEVIERVGSDGKVIIPLDENSVKTVIKELKDERVQSVAISLLFSFLNPKHEKQVKKLFEEGFPEAYCVCSHEVLPEIREFERTSTVVLAAYLAPVVGDYTRKLSGKLEELGIDTKSFYMMQSAGGLVSAPSAYQRAHTLIESGPAAGVIAAAYLGSKLGYRNIVSFDMGGTSAKASLIKDGVYGITTEYEVGRGFHQSPITRGSGYPIKAPVIDIAEIGAGGGSIAWIDPAGALKVGPKSAGALPGPACYGKGGTEPTVTDAHMILGTLNPKSILGGEVKVDPELSRMAVGKLADRLGFDVYKTARGIIDIANANMVRLLRVVTVSRGYDPRDFTMVAFGGAGPLHAAELAREMKIPKVLVPEAPGVFSAMGLLYADARADFSTTRTLLVSKQNLEAITKIYDDLEAQASSWLEQEDIPVRRRVLLRSADMKYPGQNYELNISIPSGKLNERALRIIIKRFHGTHSRTYGYAFEDENVQFVNMRVTAIGKMLKPTLKEKRYESEEPTEDAVKGRRAVFFKQHEGFVNCTVYDRTKLRVGNRIQGPTVIEQLDSTVVVLPGQEVVVDGFGNLVIEDRSR